MGARTGIGYVDSTLSPAYGCSPVSPACDHCYAARMAGRLGSLTEGTHRNGKWTGKINLFPERMRQALRWKKPRRIFVGSMTDLFHKSIPDRCLDWVSLHMALAPQHTFMLLTKRPERMQSYISAMPQRFKAIGDDNAIEFPGYPSASRFPWPLPNVWLGVTAENQEQADARIPILLDTPAAKRFVSIEPMLGPVGLSLFLGCDRPKEGEISEHRRNSLRNGEGRRMDNKQHRRDLDEKKEESGTSDPTRLPSSQENGQRCQNSHRGPSARLSAFQGENTSGLDGQPHKREEVGQSSRELRGCNLLGEPETCVQVGTKKTGRTKEPKQQTDKYTNRGNSPEIFDRGDNTENPCGGIWGHIPNHIEGCSGGVAQGRSGKDSRLLASEVELRKEEKYKGPIHLVICGGETGPGSRPMHPDWVSNLRDQCVAAEVPFFMKKMSGGGQPPADLMIREFPNANT